MILRDEIAESFRRYGPDGICRILFEGVSISEASAAGIMASLLAGHHLLLAGPPGVGKTMIAERIVKLLADRNIVAGCPVYCNFDNPECPWCRLRISNKERLHPEVQPGISRVRKVSGSAELSVTDLIGDLDPQLAIKHGIFDLRAFIPGKLLRANGGILLIDFIDRIRERVLNGVLAALAGDGITIGNKDQVFPLDTIIIATGAVSALEKMSADLSDHFDVITLGNVEDEEFEKGILSGGRLDFEITDKAMQIVADTRLHDDLSRGISTRGAIRYGEIIASFSKVLNESAPAGVLPISSIISLPHRVQVAPHAESNRTANEIIDEIVQKAVGGQASNEDIISISKENLLSIVEEIARVDHFRKPLKFGHFDLLLKRIKRFPESELAKLHETVLERLLKKYKERDMEDNLTFELLEDIDIAREKQEKLSAELRAKLEAEALIKTLDMLEDNQILARGERGYNITRRGITLLLEKLSPRVWDSNQIVGQGRHRTGKKLLIGEGRIVGMRNWRFGDRYRDISFKDTLRQAIRNRRQEIQREDIMVVKRDIRNRMDIVICLDLSGTMEQLDKLWYGKESAIALSMATANYGDRIGLVSFSNMAKVVSDLTSNAYRLTERVLDLDLHENAFTNIGFGLLTARALFSRHSRSKAKQHIILVSDGDATAPHPSPGTFAIKEAAKTIRKGITISCICINEENADPDLMHKIARIGHGQITMIGDTREIKDAIVAQRMGIG